MYKQFYLTTPEGEQWLRDELKSNPEQLGHCRKRLEELDALLRHGEDRCHASRDQRNFLRRVLASN
jgi:DNA-binding PadR family transcriptional regulator